MRDDIELQEVCPEGSGNLLIMLLRLASRDYKTDGTRVVRMSNNEIARKMHWGKSKTVNAIEALERLAINGQRIVEVGKSTRGYEKDSKRPFGITEYCREVCGSSSLPFEIGELDPPEIPFSVVRQTPTETASVVSKRPTEPVQSSARRPLKSGSVVRQTPTETASLDPACARARIQAPARGSDSYTYKEQTELQSEAEEEEEPKSYNGMLGAYGKASGAGRSRRRDVPKVEEPTTEVELSPELQELDRLRDTDVEAWKKRITEIIREHEDMADEDPLTESEKFGTKEERKAMAERRAQESREAVWREKFPGVPIPTGEPEHGLHIVKDGRRVKLTPGVALRAIGYDIPLKAQGALN